MDNERGNKLFYFTASSSAAQKHVDKTIKKTVNLMDYADYINNGFIDELEDSENVNMWGATPGKSNKSNWNKLKKGDRFLLYGSNQTFTHYGKVIAKVQNNQLAESIWGTTSKGDTWEYIFFVEIISEININIKEFNKFVGYSENFTPQGFSFIADSKLDNILKEFSSIDAAITSLNNGIDYEDDLKQNDLGISEDIKNDQDLEYKTGIKSKIKQIQNYINAKGFSYKPGTIENFYLSLKTKPFVLLAGISGTGKTKLVQLFAEAIGCNGEQFNLISVRPDWSDTSDLLGYTDIKGKFQPGPLINTIKLANQNPTKPYLVCLDEMNLARVEYYFSDFLSKMETRKYNQGKIVTDELLSNINFTRDEYKEGKKHKYEGLYLSENLYIVGTVNMDETTHPFSKKVLDRANTIEFNQINLMDLPTKNDLDIETLNEENQFLKTEYLNLIEALPEKNSHIEQITGILRDINEILKSANLHAGYRIRDEINFYMIHADNFRLFSNDNQENQNRALDYQIKQKILPRIQGSSRELKNILIDLFDYFADTNFKVENRKISEQMIQYLEENQNVKYPQSADKVAHMIKRYEQDGFTAFWI